MTAPEVVAAIRETAAEILEWSRSPANTGPCANEAYRTNIHITAALAKLAAKLEHAE
jgi:hypothetical protein